MHGRDLKRLGLIAAGACLAALALAEPSDDLLGSPGSAAGPADGNPDFSKVQIVDAVLEDKVELARVGSRRGENGLLGVFAGLRNKTPQPIALEVETIYRDKAGHELNSGSWIRFDLGPRERSDYRSAAISEDAVDFTIRVRRAHATSASSR